MLASWKSVGPRTGSGTAMWLLVITFLFYGDPSTGHFNSTVTSIDFTSQQRCDDGRKAFLTELIPIRDKLNQAITDGLEVGQLKGSNGIVISALCVQK